MFPLLSHAAQVFQGMLTLFSLGVSKHSPIKLDRIIEQDPKSKPTSTWKPLNHRECFKNGYGIQLESYEEKIAPVFLEINFSAFH